MMRLPRFEYRAPATVAEAARILAGEGPRAALLAGGTDLLPNMKRRHQLPEVVVALRRIDALRAREVGASGLVMGAGTTLAEIAGDRAIAAGHAALRRAAGQVATPHLRNAATLGGNLCLDTRCTYYDQNEEWRSAIEFCMKCRGETCWVAPSSKRCLAVSSSDGAPALIALRAEVELEGEGGTRRLPLAELYADDGIAYLTRRPDEILTRVHVPPADGWRTGYWKLRRRGSIDFPVVGVACALKLVADGVEDARLVLGAVASRPLVAAEAAAALVGRTLTDDAIDEAAGAAAKLAKPMDNADFTLHWRKATVRPLVAGILRHLRGDAADTLPLIARHAAAAGPSA